VLEAVGHQVTPNQPEEEAGRANTRPLTPTLTPTPTPINQSPPPSTRVHTVPNIP
jgi:hypothetical protein